LIVASETLNSEEEKKIITANTLHINSNKFLSNIFCNTSTPYSRSSILSMGLRDELKYYALYFKVL
jgi:hypothetical protein